jgi:hypothetical protein
MRASKFSRLLIAPAPAPKTARGTESDSRPQPPAWRLWIGISLAVIGPLSVQGAELPEPSPALNLPLSPPSASPSPSPTPSAPPFPRTPPSAQAHERMSDALAPSLRVVANSARFALTFPGEGWFAVDPQSEARFAGLDLAVFHREGGAWLKGRLARRSNRGVEGALIDEAVHVKYLVNYDPENVETEISVENYRGSALYCGRLRQGSARKACALVAVALHGRQMVRIHALVDAKTPRRRDALLSELQRALASLELLDPPATPPGAP